MSQEEKLPKILIVEDDERLARLTQEYLIRNGLEVGVEPDGNRAIRRIIAEQPDMVVLDVMLPGADGLTICREVRPHYHQPILMLSSRTEARDQVLGLEMGGDDCVAQPGRPRGLVARIRALLRRTDKVPEDEVAQRIEFDDLVIDKGGRSVTLNGDRVDFTSAEYDLLWLLASNAGRILSREDIFERLRGIEYDGQDRSIDVRISRIRPKIDRKSTRLNSSHVKISYAVFCLKKKKNERLKIRNICKQQTARMVQETITYNRMTVSTSRLRRSDITHS